MLWMVPFHSYPPPPIPLPIVLIALISRCYLELFVQQVRSPSCPLSSLTVLIGLRPIPYHADLHLRSSPYPYSPLFPSVNLVLADLNEGHLLIVQPTIVLLFREGSLW